MNQLFSIKDVANILGVSGKTLRRWEEKGILVPLRTRGNQRRYMRDQIDNFRQERGDLPEPQTESPEITPSQLFSEFPEQREVGTQYWTENAIKSILTFKKFAVYAVFAMVFVAGSGLIIAALNSANILNGGSKSISESPQASEVSTGGKAVLGVGAEIDNLIFGVKVQSEFAESAQFLDTIKVAGIATLSGGVITENQDVNAGTGRLTASNVLYGAVGGTGITVGPGQTPTITNTGVLSLTAGSGISVGTGTQPTISNTGVLSLGGSTGALTLKAGTGISISALTITNSSPGTDQLIFGTVKSDLTSISASSNTDTITLASGTGITLTPDTTNKKITFGTSGGVNVASASCITASGGIVTGTGSCGTSISPWYEDSSVGSVYLTNSTLDLFVGGQASSSAKFAVLNMTGALTPTASISAGTATTGGAYLSAAGTLATTNKQTLTLGDTNTGNILIGTDATARNITIGGASTTGLSLTDDNWSISAAGAGALATLDTGQGANELYDMDQNVLTSSAVTFATLDTGQGANELYDMDQNVLTSSSPTFAGLTLSGLNANNNVVYATVPT